MSPWKTILSRGWLRRALGRAALGVTSAAPGERAPDPRPCPPRRRLAAPSRGPGVSLSPGLPPATAAPRRPLPDAWEVMINSGLDLSPPRAPLVPTPSATAPYRLLEGRGRVCPPPWAPGAPSRPQPPPAAPLGAHRDAQRPQYSTPGWGAPREPGPAGRRGAGRSSESPADSRATNLSAWEGLWGAHTRAHTRTRAAKKSAATRRRCL